MRLAYKVVQIFSFNRNTYTTIGVFFAFCTLKLHMHAEVRHRSPDTSFNLNIGTIIIRIITLLDNKQSRLGYGIFKSIDCCFFDVMRGASLRQFVEIVFAIHVKPPS